MLTSLAFLAALSLAPGQTALSLTNSRPTYGALGSPRPDSKVLPGDRFYIAFDIQNIKENDKGQVQYTMAMEVTDSKGKIQYKQEEPKDRFLNAENHLSGARLPAFSFVDVGLDMPAGKYTMKVTVNDKVAKTTANVSQDFEVLPLGLGLTHLETSYDPKGEIPAPTIAVPGQSLILSFAAVGFSRDKAKGQPHFTVEMTIIDNATKKPTLAKPFAGEFTQVPENHKVLPLQFPLSLNRPGKFTVELKLTDLLAKKSATLSFPLEVVGPSK